MKIIGAPIYPGGYNAYLRNKIRFQRYELWAWRIVSAALIVYLYLY